MFNFDDFTYQKHINWKCSVKSCKVSLKTDSKCTEINEVNGLHNHESDKRKDERKQIRANFKQGGNKLTPLSLAN